MAKKSKTGLLSFLSNRNNILILLVIVIIIATALLIMGSEEEERIYDIEDIKRNPEDFIGKAVTVSGYYDSSYDTIHDENPSDLQGTYDIGKEMDVDITAINETKLDGNNEFLFTGKVTSVSGNLVLEVTKVKRHR